MQLNWFARKVTLNDSTSRSRVHLLLRWAVPAISFCVFIMLLSISVLSGFKHEVKNIVRLGIGDVVVREYNKSLLDFSSFVRFDNQVIDEISKIKGIRGIRAVVQTSAVIKTKSSFDAVTAIGYSSYDIQSMYTPYVIQGAMPHFDERDSILNPIVLSQPLAKHLNLSVGDKVRLYIGQEHLSVRKFQLVAIVESTNALQQLVIVPQMTLHRALNIDKNQYSRLELFTANQDKESTIKAVIDYLVDSGIAHEQHLGINSAEELNAFIFDWLNMLDPNLTIMLILMSFVTFFTIINALLVLVLDRVSMIGLLKALGMKNKMIVQLFVRVTMGIVVKGLVWGSSIALLVSVIQTKWHLLKLSPETYFVSYVPIRINPVEWVIVIASIFVLCSLVLLLPSYVITKVSPVKSIKFD